MLQTYDAIDNKKDLQIEEVKKQAAKKNNLVRLIKMSEPMINIYVGIISSIFHGGLTPCFGILLGKILFALSESPDQIRKDADYYCLWMFLIAVASFFAGFIQKVAFGVIGENVTFKIRKTLYSSILQKNIGFFDDKANAPGVLSASMASDA